MKRILRTWKQLAFLFLVSAGPVVGQEPTKSNSELLQENLPCIVAAQECPEQHNRAIHFVFSDCVSYARHGSALPAMSGMTEFVAPLPRNFKSAQQTLKAGIALGMKLDEYQRLHKFESRNEWTADSIR